MNKKSSIWDKYAIYVWGIVILLMASIMLVPFIPGQVVVNGKTLEIFGKTIFYTPVLILPPVLMGIIYAVVISYETPNISIKKKKVFKAIKITNLVLFYAFSIAVIVLAAINNRIIF